MSGATVPAFLRRVTRIAADRAVSTTSVRFVQGLVPEIERKMAQGDRESAYISRDQIAEHTGLDASKSIQVYYPRQAAEVGIIHMARKGKYGLVPLDDGNWRGQASGWTADMDAYTPTDIPRMKLETEPLWGDIDRAAVKTALGPTTSTWAKEPEAHRLVLALIHHAGLKRVRLDARTAAEILGKSRVTGWRVLKRLEALGLYLDGWVDISSLLIDRTLVTPHEGHQEVVDAAKLRRWSVFTKEGWAARSMTKQWIRDLPTLRREEVRREHWDGLSGTFLRALAYVRDVLDQPFSTGRPVEI